MIPTDANRQRQSNHSERYRQRSSNPLRKNRERRQTFMPALKPHRMMFEVASTLRHEFHKNWMRLGKTNAQGARDYFKSRRQAPDDFAVQLDAHFFVFVGWPRDHLLRQHVRNFAHAQMRAKIKPRRIRE